MGDFIRIDKLRASSVIGLFDWERRVRQTLYVDLVVRCDMSAAGATDHISDTLDYKALSKRVRAWIQTSRYRLIETLACDVAALCLEDPRAQGVRVTIHKRGALRHAKNVGVSVERQQGEVSGLAAHQVYVGVGSNLEPLARVRDALRTLQEEFGAIRVSPTYRTDAVGMENAPDFLNLVVGFRTNASPEEIVTRLHEIETACGRVRTTDRNAPRTLDLDLLLYDDLVRDAKPRLPHPQVDGAPFVLVPLAALAPWVVHPVTGECIEEMRARLPVDPPGIARYEDDVVY